jgi:hypothetical protein
MKMFVFLFFVIFGINAQSVIIDPSNANSNIVSATSTNKAVQLPRVNDTQSIGNPQVGQLMYNSETASPNFYNGSAWQNLSNHNLYQLFPKSQVFVPSSIIEDAQSSTKESFTFQIPVGVKKIWVEAWSGGSGAQDFDVSNNLITYPNRKGGNGGGYLSFILDVVENQLLGILVGKGGKGQLLNFPPYNGGNTDIVRYTNGTNNPPQLVASVSSNNFSLNTGLYNINLIGFFHGERGSNCTWSYQRFENTDRIVWKGGNGGNSKGSLGGEGVQFDESSALFDVFEPNHGGFPGGGGGVGRAVGGNGASGMVIIRY